MAEQRPKKKVVESTVETPAADASAPTWRPTAEAKSKATRFRIIAAILWVLAIAGEAFAIFWVLRQDPIIMWLLIVMFVVIGALAIVGGQLWKKANDLDPASRKDPVRFFIQNQLGAIISVVAFLPLIILVFTNKNMTGGQKALAGIIGIVIAGAAVASNIDYSPASQEEYANQAGLVQDITGADKVYWTTSGSVYHLCEEASAVNKESADNTIHAGTIAQAQADGKARLTLQLPQELKECGYTDYVLPENWQAVVKGEAPFVPSGEVAPAVEPTPDGSETPVAPVPSATN